MFTRLCVLCNWHGLLVAVNTCTTISLIFIKHQVMQHWVLLIPNPWHPSVPLSCDSPNISYWPLLGSQGKWLLLLFGAIGSDAPVLGSWHHICIEKWHSRVDGDIWLEKGEKNIKRVQTRIIFHYVLWIQFVKCSVYKVLQWWYIQAQGWHI